MADMGPDEAHARSVGQLGDEFGGAYYHAHAEWCDLWLTWKQFKNLFCQNKERIDLMKRTGDKFFLCVERAFLDSILLGICRLTDNQTGPTKKGETAENLTVKRFEKFMKTSGQKRICSELIGTVTTTTEFARKWRDKVISHNDLHVKLGAKTPPDKVEIGQVDGAIKALFDFFKFVNLEFFGSDLASHAIDGGADEMEMLITLYLGESVIQNKKRSAESSKSAPIYIPDWLKRTG
jgi:hypothetical protein